MVNEIQPGIAPEVLRFDGLCEPDPGGFACWGWVAFDAASREVAHAHGCIGRAASMTSNLAQYHGLIYGLCWLQDHGATGVAVRGDSELVIRQMRGEYGCDVPHLSDLRDGARRLVDAVRADLRWVPCEENESAARYSRMAYQLAQRTPDPDSLTGSWMHMSQIVDPRADLVEDTSAWERLLRLAWRDDQARDPDAPLAVTEALCCLRTSGARLVRVATGWRLRPAEGLTDGEWREQVGQHQALTPARAVRLLALIPLPEREQVADGTD